LAGDGEGQMMAVSSVLVPEHGTARFAPGGYRLMCMLQWFFSPAKSGCKGSAPITFYVWLASSVAVDSPIDSDLAEFEDKGDL
jgi:copper(I)-binding protein